MRPRRDLPLSRKTLARLAGLSGGAVGTTFGALTSLSFAVYFDAIRMPMDQFRATMSAALVAMGLIRGAGYLAIGEFTVHVWLFLAMTVPMALVGIYPGNRFFAAVTEVGFRWLVSLALILSGFALLVK
jgi:uncharacterized membrane protein YfcA